MQSFHHADSNLKPNVGVVLLTQGKRPQALINALHSILNQDHIFVNVVVVGNGWDPGKFVASFSRSNLKSLYLTENLGIPVGRNRGSSAVSGEWIFFIDDDAELASSNFLKDAIKICLSNPKIGMLQPRVVDPTGLQSPHRWVPRIRVGNPTRPSVAFSVMEATILLRRDVFDAAGGWAEPFFYAHEGIELAWRVWDQGYIVWYAANLVSHHPFVIPTRHSFYYRFNARNRVWLAKRNLPFAFIPFYVASWTMIQVVRSLPDPKTLAPWFAGWLEGWKTHAGQRKPLRAKTVLRMVRHGRPPIV